ncbi:hypothetical protein WN944_022080 [Citrus x changshan-huyou]|uniref:At1g61320/AtMIF1 LRR domain-containing protein n=1 Tax=Citrus x changshan-huyou TaxID=2935761 RepID=A0AAP0R0Z5_9ROSI
MLEKLISALPLLEDLSVTRCCSLKRTKISSDRLKYLLLGYCKLTEIDIDTPNLLSFTYKNNPINCIMSTTAPCSWKADISYKGYNLDNPAFSATMEKRCEVGILIVSNVATLFERYKDWELRAI